MNEKTYASPFSWRYGRPELRELFSEHERRKLWRAVWIALAESQMQSGLVTRPSSPTCARTARTIDLDAALAIEREIGHDLMAEIRVFASQATIGGGKLHLGATSMDIEDTVETFRLRRGSRCCWRRSTRCWSPFAPQIERYADLVCMGYTHLQPAEPTTVGYRLAVYAQDLLIDRAALRFARHAAHRQRHPRRGRHLGLVHAAARRRGRTPRSRSATCSARFELEARDVATQTYPRKLDYLAALAAGRPRRLALEVRRRRAHPELARLRRDVRAVR